MFQTDLLAGKRVLVTGGGSGLGRAMAERALELGAELFICGRRGSVLDDAAAEMTERHGGSVHTHSVDIRNAQAIDEMVEEIWRSGPLHGLINNAAGNFISRSEDLSPRGFDAIANIVLHGTFYVTQACGKRWIAADAPASVISIVATWVWTGSPFVVPSAMSKAGVAAMTRSLAVEWGKHGIRLNAIAPGPFPTEGAWSRLMPGSLDARDYEKSVPLGRVGEHAELANLAAFLLADQCAYISGAVIPIDGGQYLDGAGGFGRLHALSDEDWHEVGAQIRAANDADKRQRD
jgi:NAD(P)-dependent dehydrogenase (short-subunit alcohol dehydrogenase family)